MPRGWWDLEKVNYARIFDAQSNPMIAAIESGSLVNAPQSIDDKGAMHRGLSAVWHHEIMAQILLPALDKVQRKAGMAQALADELVVACALERARLAEGDYPQSLDALTPRFLAKPRVDVMTAKPLIYRAEGRGYVLYSVGWNRTDDGGAPGKVLFDDQNGDWVWRME
jgi:hypothetical protein